MSLWIPLIVAVVMAGPSYLTWVTRRENRDQHATGQAKVERLIGSVDTLTEVVTDHINDPRAHPYRETV